MDGATDCPRLSACRLYGVIVQPAGSQIIVLATVPATLDSVGLHWLSERELGDWTRAGWFGPGRMVAGATYWCRTPSGWTDPDESTDRATPFARIPLDLARHDLRVLELAEGQPADPDDALTADMVGAVLAAQLRCVETTQTPANTTWSH